MFFADLKRWVGVVGISAVCLMVQRLLGGSFESNQSKAMSKINFDMHTIVHSNNHENSNC